MRQLADIVKETVPSCQISFAAGAEPDKRNYRVDFSKYARAFPDHLPRWNVRRGAQQIYESYRAFGLKRDEYEGPRYKRIAQIISLLESGQLDKTLRWRGTHAGDDRLSSWKRRCPARTCWSPKGSKTTAASSRASGARGSCASMG